MRTYFAFALFILLASTNTFGQGLSLGRLQPRATKPRTPFAEGYFAGADGVRLFYRKVGFGRDVAVYLHGGPGANFRGQNEEIEPLAKGRTIIFYDQRGSGLSEVISDSKLLTAAHHVRDLEALRQHFGVERMTLIALSWGAALAAMYTAQHAERIERLLLISLMAPTEAFDEVREKRLRTLLDQTALARRQELRRKIASGGDEEAVAACRGLIDINIRQYLAKPTPGKLRQAARRCDIPPAAIRNRYVNEQAVFDSHGPLAHSDFRPMLARFRMPVLVLEGTDTAVPLDATREWAATIPTARLLLILDAGHELFLDQPTAFRKATEQFLRGRFPKGAAITRKAAPTLKVP